MAVTIAVVVGLACGCPENSSTVDGGEGDGGAAAEPAPFPGVEPSAEPSPSPSPIVDGGFEDGGVVDIDGGVLNSGWRGEPALPSPRQETAVLAIDDVVYVLGGYNAPPGQQIQSSVFLYDVTREEWSNGVPLPAAAHHINAAVVGGEIFALGSLRASFAQSGECFAFSPDTGQWRSLSPMPEAVARGAGVAVAIGTDIYVVGGYRNFTSSASVSVYDTALDTWSEAPALPTALDHLVAGNVDGQLVVAGGRLGGITAHQPETYVFDDAIEEWLTRQPMPTSRAGAAFAVAGGSLYVIGGEGAPNATGVFEEVEAYDVAADQWRTLSPMSQPRHGMGAAVVGNRIYVPGGADVQAFAAVDTVRSLLIEP